MVKSELKLNIKDSQPFHFMLTRVSYAEKEKVRDILNNLQERGIIRPSKSDKGH